MPSPYLTKEAERLGIALEDYKPYPALYDAQGFVDPKPILSDFNIDADDFGRDNRAQVVFWRWCSAALLAVIVGVSLWAIL